MDDVTRKLPSPEGARPTKRSTAPPGMAARWFAALLGGSGAALMIGVVIARVIDADPRLAAASGGFMAICAWAVLAPLAIAQRSGVTAWLVVASTFLAAFVLARWV